MVIISKFPKSIVVTQNALTGHMWPVGRVFETLSHTHQSLLGHG